MGLHIHGDGMKSELSKVNTETSRRSKKGTIRDADLVSSGENRLCLSETKVISMRQNNLFARCNGKK